MFRKPYSKSNSLGAIIEDPNAFVQRATDKGLEIAQQRPGGASVFDVPGVIAPSSKIGKVATSMQAAQQIMTAVGPGTLIPPLALLNIVKVFPGGNKFLAPLTGMMDQMLGPLKGIVGSITSKVFGKFFAKATHMESCMNWWTDSNIGGMIRAYQPIAIDITSYYPGMSPQLRKKYDELMAQGDKLGVNILLNPQIRRARMVDLYIKAVRANPELMTMECAAMPQGRAETGVQFDTSYTKQYWDMFKQGAQQQEYMDTLTKLEDTLNPLNILQISPQEWEKTQQSRAMNLVVTPASPGGVVIPTYKDGALSIIPGQSQANYVKTITVGKSTRRK